MKPIIAGTHKPLHEIQKASINCMICEKPLYLSGYGIDDKDKVQAMEYEKGIALECLLQMVVVYGSAMSKYANELRPGDAEKLKNLEVTNKEYLEELQRMTPVVKQNPRLGFLMGYMNEMAKLENIQETPEGMVKQFMKDMDTLVGIED